MLAARLMLEQGIHVEGINFFTGFCVEGHTHAIRRDKQSRPLRNNALWVAEQLGIKLHFVDVVEEYKQVLFHPRYGYGANFNPCLDCKIFMVGKALQWMEQHGFDFIVSGEVVGQRPMSQRKDTMPLVQRRSGAEDRLLRPLSASNLPPTLPEREGWVDRSLLHGFNGRSRKPQMALAEAFGLHDYAQPAGGCCFLTDPQYALKLRDLIDSSGQQDYQLDDILLLKVGRHFRPCADYKLIVAREEGESNYLRGYRNLHTWLEPVSHAGPFCIGVGVLSDEDLHQAGALAARYSKGRQQPSVEVAWGRADGRRGTLRVAPMDADAVPKDWLL
jgi:tRNA-specific 2-thiouridylase